MSEDLSYSWSNHSLGCVFNCAGAKKVSKQVSMCPPYFLCARVWTWCLKLLPWLPTVWGLQLGVLTLAYNYNPSLFLHFFVKGFVTAMEVKVEIKSSLKCIVEMFHLRSLWFISYFYIVIKKWSLFWAFA